MDAHGRPPAGAGIAHQEGDVARTVAQERRAFAAQAGDHQFALLAIGQDFAGLRVDDLGVEVVLVEVLAVLALALGGDAGADQLGQAVDVVRADVELGFDLDAHVLAPRLGAETAGAQRQLGKIDSFLARRFGEEQRVRRRAGQVGGAEIAHHHQLAPGVARRDRQDVGADFARAVMHAEAAGEHAVAVAVLHRVALDAAGHRQRSRHDVGPQVEVGLGVGADHRRPGRPRRGVDFDQLAAVTGEQAVGVGLAQLVLDGERQLGDVFEAGDRIWIDAGAVELVAVKRNARIDALDRLLQTRQLQRLTRLV